MLTLALATVRTRWAAFAGTFAALALGVSVIAMMALVLSAASSGGPHQSPERFAAAHYVIQVDPNLQVRDRYGSTDSVPLLTQPDILASVIAQLPGATPDRSFYAQVAGMPAAQAALGHGWSSAAFAPYVLTSGHAPAADDEIVVAGSATVGSRVPVITASGTQTYTIAGTVRPRTGEQPVFFTDAEAARLEPQADALVTNDAATAARAAALPGVHLDVLTGAGRHSADPGAVQDSTELTGLTTFLGIAALLSAFVAISVTASAFGLSVAQRRRDLALLRSIGATPRQVVRAVVVEAALVGAGGAAAGCLLGLACAPQLASWIVRKGLAPSWFGVSLSGSSVAPLVIAFVAGVAVAVASVLVAAIRAGAIRPAEALREASIEPKRAGRIRLLIGIVVALCGVVATAVVALFFPSAATDLKTQAEMVILLVVGTALMTPYLLRPLTRPFGGGTAGMLLRANVAAGAGRLAAAIVPVLIAVALTGAIPGATDTATAAAGAAEQQQAASANFVVLPTEGPGLTTAFMDQIRAISGVQETTVTDTSMLAYQPQITSFNFQSPIPIPFSAIGIDQPSAALSLKVTAGSLRGLNDQTIAVDSSWGKHVGDTMSLWQPDGTRITLKVIAVMAAGLSGASLVVDLHNADATMPSRAYVKVGSSAASAALLAAARSQHVQAVPALTWTAAVSSQQGEQNEIGLELLVGIAIAYCAIGIASTFGMTATGRKNELVLLRKTGATRRQVVWFIGAEALALTLSGVFLSAMISVLVLGGLCVALASAGSPVPVVLPWPLIGAIAGGCVVISVLSSSVPVWVQFWRQQAADAL
jgi:putative ABC transport system permease protein